MARQNMLRLDTSDVALAAARMLIASYFIAKASGFVVDSDTDALVKVVLPDDTAAWAAAGFVYLTAFFVMVGRYTRGAALLLATYSVWSSIVANVGLSSQADVAELWSDLAMVGALLLVSLTHRGTSQKMRLSKRKVAPRRITIRPSTPETPPEDPSVAKPALVEPISADNQSETQTTAQDGGGETAIEAIEDIENVFIDLEEHRKKRLA
ncbi:MAG: hypothetical protein HUJ27_05490 [Rhodobacteraceae bacterium]|nr:hypothetical protein [Paracoccaceae bacterium]